MSETPGGAGPVFVVGCPRSGTSALSWAIAAQPGYWTSAETHFFYYLLRETAPSIASAFKASAETGSWLEKHGVSYREFLQHVGHGLDRLMLSRSDGMQWIDGSPENALVAEELLAMFPTAQMFCVVRNPHAVCRSMLVSGFATPWASDIDEAISTWSHYARAALALTAEHAGRVTRIRQEDMQSAPLAVASAIAGRLRLADASAIGDFLATRRVNSSFDKSGYAPGGPQREAVSNALSPEAFEASYGDKLRAATATLAEELGYGARSAA